MVFKANFHTHTSYDDGADTPEEMVLAAIDCGFEAIGFSVHSYMPFESDWLLRREDEAGYLAEIGRLKKEYAGRIRIFNGIEKDYYSDQKTQGYDYVIGSVHCIKKGDSFFDVDDTEEVIRNACEKYYNGDFYALADDYYTLVADVINRTGCDIIGHFDLLTKFNEGGRLFDTSDKRYRNSWQKAANALLPAGVPFEINTGAIARGLRTLPYPDPEIFGYLKERNASFILTSDCHSKKALTCGFEQTFRAYGISETVPFMFSA